MPRQGLKGTGNMKSNIYIKFRLINIIGIDGAGKTTLAKGLAKHLAKNDNAVRYVYCQYFAKLLFPIKYLAKLTIMRRTDEFKNYMDYNRTKKTASRRLPFLADIYAFIWGMDYVIQLFFKVTLRILHGQRLVIDRYIFDIAVNLSLTTGSDISYAKNIIDWLLKFGRSPDYTFFIDLPEQVAIKRKDDIPDIEYLRERRQRYLMLAGEYGFTVIDGSQSKDRVLKAVLNVLEKSKDTVLKPPPGKKTILYVHANNRDIGGADFCLFKLASQLDKKRYRPVVCLGQKTAVQGLYEKEGIATHVIDMERIKKSINPFYLLKLMVKFFFTVKILRGVIRKEKVDIVHGNDLLDIYGPVAAFFEKKPATQYVRWILESPLWLKTLITSLVYRLNNGVMTVSDGVAKEMFFSKGAVLPRVATFYDWIDMKKVGHHKTEGDLRSEFGLSESTPLVGCVGRLEHWKGQEVFIRAAARVLKKMPSARFLVVGGEVQGRGRQSYGDHCKALARDLGIANQVIFTGQRSDIAHVMSSFDVFVHASVTPDPLPGVVMEAMACRTPVVGANAGGVPEEMTDKKTGLLYRPGDPDQMAKKISWLLTHPDEAKRMGEAGYHRINTKFEKQRLCKQIETCYETMMANHQSQRENFKSNPLWKGKSHV